MRIGALVSAPNKEMPSRRLTSASSFGNGWGVARNDDEACKWWRQAAALGQEAAKNNLRMLARTGHAPSIAAVPELSLGPI